MRVAQPRVDEELPLKLQHVIWQTGKLLYCHQLQRVRVLGQHHVAKGTAAQLIQVPVGLQEGTRGAGPLVSAAL